MKNLKLRMLDNFYERQTSMSLVVGSLMILDVMILKNNEPKQRDLTKGL